MLMLAAILARTPAENGANILRHVWFQIIGAEPWQQYTTGIIIVFVFAIALIVAISWNIIPLGAISILAIIVGIILIATDSANVLAAYEP